MVRSMRDRRHGHDRAPRVSSVQASSPSRRWAPSGIAGEVDAVVAAQAVGGEVGEQRLQAAREDRRILDAAAQQRLQRADPGIDTGRHRLGRERQRPHGLDHGRADPPHGDGDHGGNRCQRQHVLDARRPPGEGDDDEHEHGAARAARTGTLAQIGRTIASTEPSPNATAGT